MRTTISITRAIPFIILAIFSSCRKDEPVAKGPLSPLLIPQEVKDYTYFLPGTYWIYKEESSGAIDSVYVVSAAGGLDSSSLGSSDPELNRVFEWFEVVTKSSYDGYNYNYKIHTSFSIDCKVTINELCHKITRVKTKPGNYVGQLTTFIYKPTIGEWIYGGGVSDNKITVTDFIPNYLMQADTFKNVAKIHTVYNLTENNQETSFLFAVKAGLVRKELIDSNKVWSVIRSSLMQ